MSTSQCNTKSFSGPLLAFFLFCVALLQIAIFMSVGDGDGLTWVERPRATTAPTAPPVDPD